MADYPLKFLDYQQATHVADDDQYWVNVDLPVGGNFRPGDLRLVHVYESGDSRSGFAAAGYTKVFTYSGTATFDATLFYRVLQAGDTDTVITFNTGHPKRVCVMAVTVRNFDPTQTFSLSTNVSGHLETGTPMTNTVTTYAGGAVLLFFASAFGSASLPTGYTQLTASPDSGIDFRLSEEPSCLIAYKATPSSGSTGTITSVGGSSTAVFDGAAVSLRLSPAITATAGNAPETDTAGAVSIVQQPRVTVVVGAATETDTAGHVNTPLTGYRISTPTVLSGAPIGTSRVTWNSETYAPGSTVRVETSIDNGASWQVATHNKPVPNLLPGSTSARTVMTRVTLTRADVSDPTPRVRRLRVEVAENTAREELVPLGMFMLTETVVTSTGGATSGGGSSGGGGDGVTGSGGGASGGGVQMSLSGVDLSRVISRNPWQEVYFVPEDTNRGQAIMDMAEDRLPGVTFNFESTEHTVPKTLLFGTSQGADPWQDMQEMATAVGYELFFDANGVLTFRSVPDASTTSSVCEINDSSNPVIASLTRTLSDETTYNCVVAMGESTGNAVPVQATAIDDDPASRTYYLGPYGTRTMYYVSPMITTQEQAQAAADALLRIVKGVAETVELSIVPNPALEPGDVITVNVDDAKVAGTFLINGTDIPLSAAEAMTLTCYRQS